MILPVIAGQLPSGFCPTSQQDMLNEFSAHQSVNFSPAAGAISVVVSSTKPTDQTVLWMRLDQFGRPERVYWFASGAWLSVHPLVPGLTQWWFDVLPNFTTFDGGDALALSPISGQMWQQAKNSDGVVIAAKFPISAGTLPSGTVLAQGATGGEELHVLTESELPILHLYPNPFAGADFPVGGGSLSGGGLPVGQIKAYPTQTDVGGGLGHNNLPNFVVGYLLQRTTRQFYAIT
jgi:hypothetical protein